ncbi:MAG: tetratricopeptide repeat protein [Bacteroidota bacterium]
MAKVESVGMRIFLTIFFISVCFLGHGQQTIYDDAGEGEFSEAKSLYEMGNYTISKDKFETYLSDGGALQREATYYRAMCLLKGGDLSGENELSSFINQNPNHPLASKAYYSLGNYYFSRAEYTKARTSYEEASLTSLNNVEKSELFFKLGYCQFLKKELDRSAVSFRNSLSTGNTYDIPASYYLGYIHYQKNEYPEALNYLLKVDKSDEFKQTSSQLVASIYFKRKDEQKLASYIDERYSDSDEASQKLYNRLLGELYFDVKKYQQAGRYLQRYLEQSGNKMDEEGFFKLAFSYYMIKDDQNAINYFQNAGLGSGPMSQVSSYYLGQLYVRNDNPEFAIRSFEKAMSGSNNDIKEESTFLVGKINYQQGQFSESIRSLQQFLEQYPNNKFKNEANQLLATAFLKTSNYDQAIQYLETIPNKSTELKRAYQNAAFHKGQLVFNDSRFKEAIYYFTKSISVPIDKEMSGKAYYLLGECYSLVEDYSQAIKSFQQSKRTLSRSDIWNINADYGLGYIYYNQKDFSTARDYFRDFTSKSGNYHDFYLDAMMRLADCNYVLKDYAKAIQQYDLLTRQPSVPKDYIYFQLGLTYQLSDQPQKAINSFEVVVNYEFPSSYKDNALFQIGLSYLEINQYKNAITYFDRFERDMSTSPLMPYVRSKRALCYFNLNQLEFAGNDYRAILENNITHPAANDALLGLQELRKKGLSVPSFERYMAAYQQANPEDGSLEVISFENAKTYYYNQEYQKAIEALNGFQEKYPRSSFREDAEYFLGDSYYRLEDWVRAVEVFTQIIRNTSSNYLSRVLDKRGRALIRMGEYQQALYNYTQLAAYGVNRKDQYLADEGKLISHFQLSNNDSAFYYSDKIINSDWKPVGAESQAALIQGKVFLRTKQYDQAVISFQQVLQDTKSEVAAEAKYQMAYIQYLQGNYKGSVETLFELNEAYASYDYWIGKSFILIADNYLKMNELYQAQATLNSIIEKSPVKSIVSEAKVKLADLEKEREKVIESDTVKNG